MFRQKNAKNARAKKMLGQKCLSMVSNAWAGCPVNTGSKHKTVKKKRKKHTKTRRKHSFCVFLCVFSNVFSYVFSCCFRGNYGNLKKTNGDYFLNWDQSQKKLTYSLTPKGFSVLHPQNKFGSGKNFWLSHNVFRIVFMQKYFVSGILLIKSEQLRSPSSTPLEETNCFLFRSGIWRSGKSLKKYI